MPQRIQRKRTKGWKMPLNCIYVGRPTKWGNPFIVGDGLGHYEDYTKNVDHWTNWPCKDSQTAVDAYRSVVANDLLMHEPGRFHELRGKDLACWCPLDQPCHADVLLKIANADEEKGNQ